MAIIVRCKNTKNFPIIDYFVKRIFIESYILTKFNTKSPKLYFLFRRVSSCMCKIQMPDANVTPALIVVLPVYMERKLMHVYLSITLYFAG